MAEENSILLRKEGEDYCKVLRREGTDSVGERHFRADSRGNYRINGERHRLANVTEPDTPVRWRGLYEGDVEEFARRYEEEGWVRIPLDSFEDPLTELDSN